MQAEVEPIEAPAQVEAVESKKVDSLRAALRGSVQTEEWAALLEDVLVEALHASKETWHTCPNCSKRSPVAIADLGTRAQAATRLIELLEGRAKEESSRAKDELDRDVSQMLRRQSDLSNAELAEAIILLERELAELDEEAA